MADRQSREVNFNDPNMTHEGVLSYREQFNLTPNRGFRRDIAVTVKTYDDLCIWNDLLSHWGYFKDGKWKKRSPLDIKGMLTVFEFKQREAQRKKDEISNATRTAEHSGKSRSKGIPERSASVVPIVLERKNGWAG